MNVELTSYDRTKETPYKAWNKINRIKKAYSNGGKIRRNGKTLSLQDFINENNKDLTIYDVYNTYRGDMKLTQAKLNTLTHKVADELTEVKDLPTALQVLKATEKSWNELPLEIKKEFNNNVHEFQKGGLKWANNKIAEYKAREQARLDAIAQAQQQQNQTSVVTPSTEVM